MKKFRILCISILLGLIVVPLAPAQSQYGDILKGAKKMLSGLFVMVAEEEKNIRRNPAARVTDLLKEVFGNK